jgi:hypothetical protein
MLIIGLQFLYWRKCREGIFSNFVNKTTDWLKIIGSKYTDTQGHDTTSDRLLSKCRKWYRNCTKYVVSPTARCRGRRSRCQGPEVTTCSSLYAYIWRSDNKSISATGYLGQSEITWGAVTRATVKLGLCEKASVSGGLLSQGFLG